MSLGKSLLASLAFASAGMAASSSWAQVQSIQIVVSGEVALESTSSKAIIEGVERAKGALREGNIAAKGQAIGHAVRIIDEGLKAALDLKAGGKLAADLSDLYAYVCLRLIQANLNSDEAALDECVALLSPLREAWQAIGPRVDNPASN